MEEENACCSEWKKRFAKLEEKRNALRQAVKLLEHQTVKLQNENLQIKQAIEREKLNMKLEKEAKEKELGLRQELEKENKSLKMELSSLHKDEQLRNADASQNQLLETRILEGEAEVKALKVLLEKEKKKWQSEKKKYEEERNRAAEAQSLVEVEKRNVEKEKKLCELERKKAEEYKLDLEKLKIEASLAREALIAEKTKAGDASRKMESGSQKLLKEKKHANKERKRAEEARRLFEAERKKAVDEKEHAKHLEEQLETERQKREKLQKEMERKITISNAKDCACLKDNTCTGKLTFENDSVVLLKEKLELEKKHVKHAKRMAKLQEAENELLKRELNLLKKEIINISCHLNFLGGNLFQSVKGIADLEKIKQPTMPMGLNRNMELDNIVQHEHKCPGGNEVARTHCATFDSFHHTTRDARCIRCVFQEMGGNISCPTSGTFSGLESPIRDSTRIKSQCPVACSTTASFSDRSFMGSQERGPLAVTTTKSAEKKLKCRDVHISDEKVPPNLDLTYDENETVESKHRRKRRKIEDTLESVTCLYMEDKKLQSRIEEKLGVLSDLILEMKSFPTSNCFHTKELSKSLDNKYNYSDNSVKFEQKSCHHGKKKESKKQNVNFPLPRQNSNHDVNLQNIKNVEGTCQNTRKKVGRLIEDEEVDLFSNLKNDSSFPYFKDMNHGNFVRLFELDDDSDEEKYRLAMARPLSPTLPILTPSRFPNSSHLGGSVLGKITKDGSKNLRVTHISDAVLDAEKLVTEGRNFDNATEAGQTLACKGSKSCACSESEKEEITSRHEEVPSACLITNGILEKHTYLHFVTFSNFMNEESMLRVFHFMNILYSQSSMFVESNDFLENIVSAFAFNGDFNSEEKTSIMLSMLLDHFSGQVPAELESFFSQDACPMSFETKIRAVMSESEKAHFLETCNIDHLVKLLEDFLIHRKIFVCDISNGPPVQVFLGDTSRVNGKVHISSKVATDNQLAAGIVMLATICQAFDQVDFLWKVSYKILRTCCNDESWVLTVIHGFAHVCGVKFFTLSESVLLEITVKSIVLLLELRYRSSHSQPATKEVFTFSPCAECPFAQGAVSLAKLVHTLLGKMEESLSVPMKVPSMRTVCERPGGLADKPVNNSKPCVHESCEIKHEVLMHQSSCVPSDALCCFIDVVSLLELAACYMAWDWNYGTIVLRLLKMLNSCPVDEYSSALLVLTGKLGRMGVDAEGYEHVDVTELRSRISALLDLYNSKSSSLLVQASIIGALVDLLPLSFGEIVGRNDIIFEGSCSFAKSIQSWYAQWNEEQKLLLSNLFKHTDVHKR